MALIRGGGGRSGLLPAHVWLQIWFLGARGRRVRNAALVSLLLVSVTAVELHELDAQLEQRVGGGAGGAVAAWLTGLCEGHVRGRAQAPEVDGSDGRTHSHSTLRACCHAARGDADR